jgi:hypothetical protein
VCSLSQSARLAILRRLAEQNSLDRSQPASLTHSPAPISRMHADRQPRKPRANFLLAFVLSVQKGIFRHIHPCERKRNNAMTFFRLALSFCSANRGIELRLGKEAKKGFVEPNLRNKGVFI